MEKKDLKTGDKVTYRDGTERFVALNTIIGKYLLNHKGFAINYLDNYSDKLTECRSSVYDIMKIERVVNNVFFDITSEYKTIWERQNEQHIEIQKELDALMDKAKVAGMNVAITIE